MTVYKGTVKLTFSFICEDSEIDGLVDKLEDEIGGVYGVDSIDLIDYTEEYRMSKDEYLADEINDRRRDESNISD